jgi:ATP-dependent HslUV protease ATP-binding subunit HslU
MLEAGQMEDRTVSITTETRAIPMIMGNMPGMESMELDLQEMFEKIAPKSKTKRELTVKEAREFLIEQESERLLNKEKIQSAAIELAENLGIIFIDEIDKIVASEKQHGADVSRQGVQRDLLPIVEGTTIQTKYGYVKTDHVLFIAAGAFHRSNPSDLMPELQGRFPIRVELKDLVKEDFVRILTEPDGSLTKQYYALMQTEQVELQFEPDGIDALAGYAFEINQKMQNIGARRLYTIMERLLEELSFDAPERPGEKVIINADYVRHRIDELCKDEDLSKFIL